MAFRSVRLGSPRQPGEGLRLGTVRRPPRGVPKSQYASGNHYDLWLPELAPSQALLSWIKAKPLTDQRWREFANRYRREMSAPPASHVLALLAAFSRQADFSIGCYCEDDSRCHRSLLRVLLERAAT